MQETGSLAPNKNPQTKIYRYLTRMIIGLIAAVLVGSWIDQKLHTLPLVTLAAVLYVVVGTLYLLIKEVS